MNRSVEVNLVCKDPKDPLRGFMPSGQAVEAVLLEAFQALEKHKPPTTDTHRLIVTLVKEVGEAAQEVAKMNSKDDAERLGFNDGESAPVTRDDRIKRLRAELVQVAAYALLQIQNIDAGRIF